MEFLTGTDAGLCLITQANQFFRYLTLWLVPHVGWMAIDLQYPLASRLSAWPRAREPSRSASTPSRRGGC
jgi:hypothetical protein